MPADTHFFLSANSVYGYTSFADELAKDEGTKVTYILKGGSRGARQAFFKVLGDKISIAGLSIEYLHSSAAPELLDGLSLPEIGVSFLDGTKPLLFEPEYHGVLSKYINLDDFLDFKALSSKKEEVKGLYDECKSFEGKAYRCLAAAEISSRNIYAELFSDSIAETITRRAAGICAREFADCESRGKLKKRFISAFTYEGTISRHETVNALCSRVCVIDNEFGFAPLMLRLLLDGALKSGKNVIMCPSPLYPETPTHLLIPELSLAFISITSETPYVYESYKHVRLDALVDREKYKELKPSLREDEKIYELLLEEAQQNLFFAKLSADRLEELFAPYIDNGAITLLADKYAKNAIDN